MENRNKLAKKTWMKFTICWKSTLSMRGRSHKEELSSKCLATPSYQKTTSSLKTCSNKWRNREVFLIKRYKTSSTLANHPPQTICINNSKWEVVQTLPEFSSKDLFRKTWQKLNLTRFTIPSLGEVNHSSDMFQISGTFNKWCKDKEAKAAKVFNIIKRNTSRHRWRLMMN